LRGHFQKGRGRRGLVDEARRMEVAWKEKEKEKEGEA
jgi:hypothetical protein